MRLFFYLCSSSPESAPSTFSDSSATSFGEQNQQINKSYITIYLKQLFTSPILRINCSSTKKKTSRVCKLYAKVFARVFCFFEFCCLHLPFLMQYFKMCIKCVNGNKTNDSNYKKISGRSSVNLGHQLSVWGNIS